MSRPGGGAAARASRPARVFLRDSNRASKRVAPPMPARQTAVVYYALVVSGIEDLAAAELRAAGATVRETLAGFDKRDSMLLFTMPDAGRALACATIEDVFQVVLDAPLPPGHGAPKLLARALDREEFERAMLAHHALSPKHAGRSYKVIARTAGRQAFVRSDLERAFAVAMEALLPRWVVTRERAAIELWAHVVGERAVAGVRLSSDELAQRRYKQAHVVASLKPTVARALVLLSEPQAGDIVLDPMAGAGTILRERSDASRSRLVVGGDIDDEMVSAARENTPRRQAIAIWDATRLPLRDESVDAVITNPPYGRQHEAANGLDRLYARFLRESARVLRRGGRCIVLTGEPLALARALPPTLRVRTKRRILLRGLPVIAFVMVRV